MWQGALPQPDRRVWQNRLPFRRRALKCAPEIPGIYARMSRDLYQILGVTRTASEDDIRRAYKKKAKESHPDLHPGDAAKAETFKRASAAYEILGDKAKRGQYDRGEIDADGNPAGFAGGQGFGGFQQGGSGFQGDPFEEILSGMFGGGRRRPGPRRLRRASLPGLR